MTHAREGGWEWQSSYDRRGSRWHFFLSSTGFEESIQIALDRRDAGFHVSELITVTFNHALDLFEIDRVRHHELGGQSSLRLHFF